MVRRFGKQETRSRRFGIHLRLAGTLAVVASGCDTQVLAPTEQHTSELVGLNIGGQNIGGQNIGGQNVGGHNIGGQNVGGHNISGQNVGGHNISGHNIGGQNVGGHNIGGQNVGGHNIGGQNVGGHNISGHNLAGVNLAHGADTLDRRGGAAGLLYSGEDLQAPEDRCVVLGVGSTEIATLLGRQSPDATLHAAIGKLPWGYTGPAGGPIVLAAWEVFLQGDRTHCSFVLATPVDSTWVGVAGFVKAVFRWNAPPAQTLEVSAIETSGRQVAAIGPVVETHEGMMDAGGKWRAGQISARSLVAGELAFVAATTNNRSVLVDFASWVTDASNAGLVLGHVESASPPRYAESVYYAYDNGDGSIGVAVGPASWVDSDYADDLPSSYQSLEAAYQLFQEGLFTRPVPTRCGGALFLNARHGEPMPAGKCDSTLAWTVGAAAGYRTWTTVPGATAPMSQYMLLPADGATRLTRNGKVVLSETYVHMWDVNYDLEPGDHRAREADRRALLAPSSEAPSSLRTAALAQPAGR